MATAAQVKQFINTIAPIAVKVCKERGYGNAQAWTCVAQACCESAYGTASIMKNFKMRLRSPMPKKRSFMRRTKKISMPSPFVLHFLTNTQKPTD